MQKTTQVIPKKTKFSDRGNCKKEKERLRVKKGGEGMEQAWRHGRGQKDEAGPPVEKKSGAVGTASENNTRKKKAGAKGIRGVFCAQGP